MGHEIKNPRNSVPSLRLANQAAAASPETSPPERLRAEMDAGPSLISAERSVGQQAPRRTGKKNRSLGCSRPRGAWMKSQIHTVETSAASASGRGGWLDQQARPGHGFALHRSGNSGGEARAKRNRQNFTKKLIGPSGQRLEEQTGPISKKNEEDGASPLWGKPY
jgi:hypothetical protein